MWLYCGKREREKVIRTEGVELREGRIVIIQDMYKYLGILQANQSHAEDARSTAAKYHQRVRQVLRSQVSGTTETQAIHMYALPVTRYPA